MSEIEIDYTELQYEVINKVKQARDLLLEANALVPGARFTDFEDHYDNDEYAETLSQIDSVEDLCLVDMIDSLGWNSSSLSC
jgi:hypothetical protein